VFRYQPSPDDPAPVAAGDDGEVEKWLDTSSDPDVARAVALAEAAARKDVPPPAAGPDRHPHPQPQPRFRPEYGYDNGPASTG
jgi:hypothetical protein